MDCDRIESRQGRQAVTCDTTRLVAEGQREFAELASSMLKTNVVALVFLPWLTRYTARVVEAAKEEERRAILAELSNHKSPDGKRECRAGYKAAMESVRDLVRARSPNV